MSSPSTTAQSAPETLTATALLNSGAATLVRSATAEGANSITHGLGLVLSVIASVVLIGAAKHGDAWQQLACVVYAFTMVAVYATSTLSHMLRERKRKHFFRVLDQGFIYLFITGTFTPIAATFLRDGACSMILPAMWAISIAGFLSKVVLVHRIDGASVIVPVLLGWMPLLGGQTMLELVPANVIWWVLAGGVCYTIGTLFLMLDHRHRYLHAVWHLCVIAGSACHFWAILHFTVPAMG